MKSFVLCTGCERHVRRSEAACPFCGAPVVAPPEAVGLPPLSRGRKSSLAAVAVGTALALGGGCTDSHDGRMDGGMDSFEGADVYGIPFDAGESGMDGFEGADVYGIPFDGGS
ncbi:MAG TPA: hypothetical protein VIL20_19395 [Sandaracinaceae bacterium]